MLLKSGFLRKSTCSMMAASLAWAGMTGGGVSGVGVPAAWAAPETQSDPVKPGSYTSPHLSSGQAHPGRTGALTPDEQHLAEAAWRYFINNTQASTGLVNAADAYPSATMWDTGSAIGAIVAARGLGLIDEGEASARLGKMLDTLATMPLFRDMCPNKAYNSATAARVTYTNQPGEIGCSALDVGRAMYWMRVVQQRFPALADKAAAAVAHWHPEKLVRDGQIFGTDPRPDGSVAFLQEGRLGYEEYGAKAFRLWGFDTHEAARAEPYGLVNLYGVTVPYDTRDPRVTGAHNYVVTESYVLDGIEYGWDEPDDVTSGPFEHSSGWIARSANRVYLAQERRFAQTGILTARTEHQLAGAPYFVYDTVFSDGQPWATITDTGESHPESSAVSLKGAIGLWTLWPTAYTDRLFAAVHSALDPEKGIYEGLFENGSGKIAAFTANNNGIILESLLYKLEGKILRPDPARIGPVKTSASGPIRPQAERPQVALIKPVAAPVAGPVSSPVAATVAAPIAAPSAAQVPAQARGPSEDEHAMAKVAWRYFENNTQPDTGLANAVDGYPSTTLWDTAAGFGAVVSAQRLGLISRTEAVARMGKALDTLATLHLFRGQCPNKVYNTRNATPANYSNEPAEIGCSALDAGRLLVWMKVVEQRYPELADKVRLAVRHWNIAMLVRNGELFGVQVQHGKQEAVQEGRLGYEEYSARGFAAWGLDTAKAAQPEPFATTMVEGVPIMHDTRSETSGGGLNALATESYLLDGIETGFGASLGGGQTGGWVKTQAGNVALAQQRRFERTGILTARTEHQLDQAPNFVYDSVYSEGTAFATQDARGNAVPKGAAVATKAALGIWTLWPGAYGDRLYKAVRQAFDGERGFYEGVLEGGGLIHALTANTNGIILEILLYRLDGPALG